MDAKENSEQTMYPQRTPVLVVDGDPRRRQLIERILAEEGFAVSVASEGFSALRAAQSRRFALAVAAVELPGTLDGMTAVRLLRMRQPWLKALHVGRAGTRPAALAGGADHFIAIPGPAYELIGCVFAALQREATRRTG